jgi:hypothetical protein
VVGGRQRVTSSWMLVTARGQIFVNTSGKASCRRASDFALIWIFVGAGLWDLC